MLASAAARLKIIDNVPVSIAIHQFCQCLALWLRIFLRHTLICACKVCSRVSPPSLSFCSYFDGCKWWWWCKAHIAFHKCLKNLEARRVKEQKLSKAFNYSHKMHYFKAPSQSQYAIVLSLDFFPIRLFWALRANSACSFVYASMS